MLEIGLLKFSGGGGLGEIAVETAGTIKSRRTPRSRRFCLVVPRRCPSAPRPRGGSLIRPRFEISRDQQLVSMF